jgi:molybdopterin-guanine dinucleotide biosynthesis protein B
MKSIKAVQIVGYKNSGKTTLALDLSKLFKEKGLKVGCVKFAHHSLDKADSDTDKLSKQAKVVVGISKDNTQIFFDHKKKFLEVVSFMDVDILLIEGGKHEIDFLPRIVVTNSVEDIFKLKDELTISVYSPGMENEKLQKISLITKDILELADIILEKAFFLPGINCGMCGEDSCRDLGRKILQGKADITSCASLNTSKLKVEINGKPLSLNPFIQELIESTICGLLSPLKGFHKGEVTIKFKA